MMHVLVPHWPDIGSLKKVFDEVAPGKSESAFAFSSLMTAWLVLTGRMEVIEESESGQAARCRDRISGLF